MGMVKIGGRDLRVLEDHEQGSFKRDLDLIRVGSEMKEAEGTTLQLKFAELVHCYVRDNSVTLDELVDLLPANVNEVIRQCVVASGRKPKEMVQGEAPRP